MSCGKGSSLPDPKPSTDIQKPSLSFIKGETHPSFIAIEHPCEHPLLLLLCSLLPCDQTPTARWDRRPEVGSAFLAIEGENRRFPCDRRPEVGSEAFPVPCDRTLTANTHGSHLLIPDFNLVLIHSIITANRSSQVFRFQSDFDSASVAV